MLSNVHKDIQAYMQAYSYILACVHRKLKKYMLSQKIAEFIADCALVIDLDGKFLPDISLIEDMDRLPCWFLEVLKMSYLAF